MKFNVGDTIIRNDIPLHGKAEFLTKRNNIGYRMKIERYISTRIYSITYNNNPFCVYDDEIENFYEKCHRLDKLKRILNDEL